jgi:hypothetical protein
MPDRIPRIVSDAGVELDAGPRCRDGEDSRIQPQGRAGGEVTRARRIRVCADVLLAMAIGLLGSILYVR